MSAAECQRCGYVVRVEKGRLVDHPDRPLSDPSSWLARPCPGSGTLVP